MTADREHPQLDALLTEQVAYYRARAAEYDDHGLALPGAAELPAALDAFRPTGDVLEVACGPRTCTAQLLRHANTLTALDLAPEMLSIAASAVERERVASSRPTSSAGNPTGALTWSSSGSGSRTFPTSASKHSGRWSERA